MRRAMLVAALALWASGAAAVNPSERLADPALEARARDLSRELRCLVCQNQSIDDSNADLARDLRVLVRERITAGDSDAQVKRYLTERYGTFVLLRPPLTAATVALWAAPALFALAALVAAGRYMRRRRPADAEPPLTAADWDEVAELAAERGAERPS